MSDYEDFLKDVGQFASKGEEKAFIDSIRREPPEEERYISVGERVKKVREKKGLSLQDIVQRTGIDLALLERIEQGEVSPPLGIVTKLAKSLEMKIGYFISGEEKKPFTIVRKADRKVVSRYTSEKGNRYGYEYHSLAPHKRDRHMEPFLMVLAPSDIEDERSTHEGQEFIFVLEGSMEVRLGEERYLLEQGDAIYYDSNVPHLVKSVSALMLSVVGHQGNLSTASGSRQVISFAYQRLTSNNERVGYMIAFDLECSKGHVFEGWFQNNESFDEQNAKKLIVCPYCNDTNIRKILSPVAMKTSMDERDGKGAESIDYHRLAYEILDYIDKNFVDVGPNFAKEALKMHFGVTEKKNIKGSATEEEEKMLKEEGIEFFKLPLPKVSQKKKN
ncbi:MAG: DUF1178 family protein [Deltaproteobacteria bacterium]|nr:DUF1178 family protein [Deltaproteobacteria bacterium]